MDGSKTEAGPSLEQTSDPPCVESLSSLRLNPPSMTASNIESYFLSLEFWFAASGIGSHPQNDARKYHIVMAQVPPNKLSEIRPIIDAAPAVEKYPYIKRKLIEHFADSQQKRLQRVLSDMPLGDMKPSQLYSEMRRVAGNALCEAVLLDLWASRLPPHAQAAVIASRGDATDKVTIADAIVDSMGLRNINAMEMSKVPTASESSSITSTTNSIEGLQREIAILSKKLERLMPTRNRSRSRSRTRPLNIRRENSSAGGACWYHRTFGNTARRCRKPCSFVQASSNPHAQQ